MAQTKHTCGGPHFGRRTAGCPRCEELAAGAAPTRWGRQYDAPRSTGPSAAAIAAHYAIGGPHSRCVVCTFGDW